MNTIKFEKKDVKMVAHRGLSGIERENTNPAFVAAGNRSYYGIETDVHIAADGRFVIIHDETTTRVSNGAVAVNVEEVSYDEVKDVVLPDKDGSTMRSDIRVPLLAEYIHICKKYEKYCVLELKNHFPEEYLPKLIAEIDALDYLDGMIFISFDWANCVNMRALLPEARIQFLTSAPVDDALAESLAAHRLDLDIYYPRLSKGAVDKLHANGIEVNAWTCDNPEYGARLAAMGVDYITSNILE